MAPRLAVASTIGIWLYDTATHQEVTLLTGHTNRVSSVAYSPDGNTIASGSWDNTVRLWDATTGAHKRTLTGHTQSVISVAFSPDGSTLASGSWDGTVLLWELTSSTGMGVGVEPLGSFLTTLGNIKRTVLLQNYPNPFNPETWIPYHLALATDLQITIYDTKGAIIRQLDLGNQMAGYYTDQSRAAYWDGRSELGEIVVSGTYVYTLTAGDFSATRQMLIMK